LACQKTIYQLKFQKKADCPNSHCRTTCHKVREIWGSPKSPLEAFASNTIGKCDACFRTGFCSVTECSLQKTAEKTVISKIVNQATLTGIVDNSNIKKMMKKILKNKPVNYKKYAKKVQKSVKKGLKNKKFKANFKKISESLKLLVSAVTPNDLKSAIKAVNSSLRKAKSSNRVKKSVRKIVKRFNALVDRKKASGKFKKSKKVIKSAKRIQNILQHEYRKLDIYLKRVKAAKHKIKAAIATLKSQSSINDKSKRKLGRLEKTQNSLKQVLKILRISLVEINSSLTSLRAAAKKFSQ